MDVPPITSDSMPSIRLVAILGFLFLLFMNSGVTVNDHNDVSSEIAIEPTRFTESASSGDVNITEDTLWADDTMDLERGISIQSSATLTLRNVTLNLNQDNYSSCSIEVEDGGTLIIEQGSSLNTYSNTTNMYSIEYKSGANGNISDSTITRCYTIYLLTTENGPNYILIYNNTFYDWGNYHYGIIHGQHANQINITNNDFCNPDHDSLRTIYLRYAQNATIVGNRFHDYSIVNESILSSEDRNIITLHLHETLGPIHSTISGNTFENLGISGHDGVTCIFTGPPNVTISNNTFTNIRGFGIFSKGADTIIEGNTFSNMYASRKGMVGDPLPSTAIYLFDSSFRNTIQRNSIENCAGGGIWDHRASNTTISENTIVDCTAGILLGSGVYIWGGSGHTSDNATITGNLLVSNGYGLKINDAANATIYENAFIMNDEAAQSNMVTDINWNKSSVGNLWFGHFTGIDSDHDWIADAGDTPFVYSQNITDHSPTFKVGALPPGSGDWYIDTPTVFQWNEITVDGDIDVVSPAGSLILLNTSVAHAGQLNINNEKGALVGYINASFADDVAMYSYHSPALYNCTFDGSLHLYLNGYEVMMDATEVAGMLYVHNATSGFVSRCNLSTFQLYRSSDITVSDCSVSERLYILRSIGIELQDCHLDFTSSTQATPLEFRESSDVLVYSNEIICAGKTISASYSPHITFLENDFYHASLQAHSTDFMNFTYNDFYYGGLRIGLDWALSHNVTFSYNTVDGNGGYGIVVRGENATITHNTLYNCSSGVYLAYSSASVLSHNTIYNCSSEGIRMGSNPDGIVEGNTIFDIAGDGIQLWSSNNSWVLSNNVSFTGQDGLSLKYGCEYAVVMHNLLTHCARHGLSLYEADNSEFFNNTMAFNDAAGIYVEGLQLSRFWLNVLYENGQQNIAESWSSPTTLYFDNGTHGNFWGPSGPEGNDYCTSYDTGGNPWIGDIPFDVESGGGVYYDNHPILMSNMAYLGYPNTIPVTFMIHERLYVLNTTIFCQDGMYISTIGNITFIGTTLVFESDGSYVQHIEVDSGGSLTLRGGTVITADQTIGTYGFIFRPSSYLVVNDATVDRCGYGAGNNGFRVNTTTVSIESITVSNAYYEGMILSSAPNVMLSGLTAINCSYGLYVESSDLVVVNNTFVINCSYGVYVESSDLVVVNNTFVINCNYGIYIDSSASVDILNAQFDDCDVGVQIDGTDDAYVKYSDFTGCNDYGLFVSNANTPTIMYNKFANITTGIGLVSTTNALVYLNFFGDCDTPIDDSGTGTTLYNGTHGNFYLDYTGSDPDGDLIGNSIHVLSGGTDIYPIMVWGSWPSVSQWSVTMDTYCLATNYTITGNIEIFDGATLYLYDAQLWFNCSFDSEYGFLIHNGGVLRYLGGAIRATNNTNRFLVVADGFASIHMRDVVLEGLYYIRTDTNSTVLESLTIQTCYKGIEVKGTNLWGLYIADINIADIEHTGIYIENSYGLMVSNINITDSQYGFYLEGNYDLTLSNVNIEDVTNTGLYLSSCGNITVIGCTFKQADTSIYIYSHLYGTLNVTNCHMEDATRGIYTGIAFDDNSQLVIQDTTMISIGTGVQVARLDELLIRNCTFNPHGGVAIKMEYPVESFSISDCIGFNGSDFLYITYVTNGVMDACEISNFTYGVQYYHTASMSSYVNITSNYFYGCEYGVMTRAVQMYVVGNSFEYGTDAIHTSETHELIVANNTISHFNNGVFCGDGPVNISLSGNVYSDLTNEAISLTTDVGVGWIYNETIDGCRYGILLQGTTNVTADHVTVSNAERGIFLSQAVNATLSNLTINLCETGIYIYYSKDVTLRDCTITNTDTGIDYAIFSYDTADLDIDTSNLYNGLPIYYFYDIDSYTYSNIETYHLTLAYSSFVIIDDSVVRGDDFSAFFSNNCTVVNSTINTSLYLHYCEDILIKGNSFSDSKTIVIDRDSGSNITFVENAFWTHYTFWETGYNLNGSVYGNYWYNYDGTDADFDGIGDTPFEVIAGLTDYHPLISDPWSYEVIITFEGISDDDTISHKTPIVVNIAVITGLYFTGTPSIETSMLLNLTPVETGTTGVIEYSIASSFSDGWYNLSVSSTDGTRVWFLSIGITLDTTAPILSTDNEDMQTSSSSSIDISSTATDELSMIGWIAIYIDGAVVVNRTSSYHICHVGYSLPYVEDRSHNVTIVAVDEIGNMVVETITVYFDTTHPILSSPEDIVLELGESYSLTWTVDDLTPFYYNITIGGISYENGLIENGVITYDIPFLDVGYYTIGITVTDRAEHQSYDSVEIQITEQSTTTTTTTTTVTTTDTSTTATPTPPADGDDPMMTVIVIAIGGVAVVILMVVLQKKGIIKR